MLSLLKKGGGDSQEVNMCLTECVSGIQARSGADAVGTCVCKAVGARGGQAVYLMRLLCLHTRLLLATTVGK